jgi:hypothetical protein
MSLFSVFGLHDIYTILFVLELFKVFITLLESPALGGSTTIVSTLLICLFIIEASPNLKFILLALFNSLLILAFLIDDSFISIPIIFLKLSFNYLIFPLFHSPSLHLFSLTFHYNFFFHTFSLLFSPLSSKSIFFTYNL